MQNFALLVGNDINNINPGKSWEAILDEIILYCGLSEVNKNAKPFPILYDEIFLSAVRQKQWNEVEVKRFIGGLTSEIKENMIHRRIREMNVPHVMTTNYDYTIQGITPRVNEGQIVEKLYSVFRRHQLNGTTYWHVHGECNYPATINLGYEHYCGQLQNMRNYTVTGTSYKSDKVLKKSLMGRLRNKEKVNDQSWIDLFFTRDIYIFGLKLDFVETDLWWLLTYRARNKYYRNKITIGNKIIYYIPKKYYEASLARLQVLEANGVEIRKIDEPDDTSYYQQVLNDIEALIKQ